MANAASDEDLFDDLRPDAADPASPPAQGRLNAGADDDTTDLDAGDPQFDDLNIGLDAAMRVPEDETDPTAGTDAAPPEDEQAAATGDDDSDLEGYSDRVRKRIMRERRIARQARDDAQAARDEAAAARAAVEELSGRFNQIQRADTQSTLQKQLAAAKGKVDAARAKYRQARIDGDLDAELAAQDEVNEADFQRRLLEAHLQRAAAETPADKPAAAAAAKPAAPKATPATQAWLNRNASWWGKDAVLTAAAQAIDKEIAAEGMSSADPEYFAELDRRLAKKGLRKPGASASPHRSSVAPATTRTPSSGTQGNRVTLTKEDQAFMRQMRLDPNNPAHAKQYALEKRAASRSN